jgi:hypothetical protein
MSQAHDANSWVVPLVAGGVIHPGHAVVISNGTVIECTGANTAIGVYVGEENCASGETVSICVGGPCKVFADGSSAIVIGAVLGNDTSGHFVVDTTDKHKLAGVALEALASGTGMIEMCFAPAAFNAV